MIDDEKRREKKTKPKRRKQKGREKETRGGMAVPSGWDVGSVSVSRFSMTRGDDEDRGEGREGSRARGGEDERLSLDSSEFTENEAIDIFRSFVHDFTDANHVYVYRSFPPFPLLRSSHPHPISRCREIKRLIDKREKKENNFVTTFPSRGSFSRSTQRI